MLNIYHVKIYEICRVIKMWIFADLMLWSGLIKTTLIVTLDWGEKIFQSTDNISVFVKLRSVHDIVAAVISA